MANKKRIAVLSGGWSKERAVSIKSGRAVVDALDKEKYDVAVFDPRDDLDLLGRKKNVIDLVFSVLHGKYGEDGRMQGLLDILGIPFVGSGVLASAMAMNKRVSKEIYQNTGLRVPKGITVRKDEAVDIRKIGNVLGLPVVIKPVSEGSSIGISIVEDEGGWQSAIERAFQLDDEVLVEEYLLGLEITGAVLGREKLETLPLVEIVPKENHRFFDYEAKYVAGETTEICPARIEKDMAFEASEVAKKAHQALECRDWSRTDMIVRGGLIYVLETNTIPGMTETSLVPLAAKGRGWRLSELLDKMIGTALENP